MSTDQKKQQEEPMPVESVSPFACQEKIDYSSPDAFGEPIPGAWDLRKEFMTPSAQQHSQMTKNAFKTAGSAEKANARFRTELDPDDVKLVNELGQLSADKLMEYVRNLQNVSLTLGEEEARQFARAKCLGIFEKKE